MKKKGILVVSFLVIIIFGLYWKTFSAEMIWDDKIYFQQNLLFSENRPPTDAFKIGSLREQMGLDNSDLYYRPLPVATFLIENRLWGLHPAVLRIVNLLFFLGALVVLYFFLRSLVPENYFAEIAVLLFALTPIHVDNIVWIVGRGDLMMLLWAALAFFFLERFIKTNKRVSLAVSSLFCLLGVFTKESFLFFIPIFFLYEIVRRKRISILYHAANVLSVAVFFFIKGAVLGIKALKIVPYTNPAELAAAGFGALGFYARTVLFPFSYDLFKPTSVVMRGLYPTAGVAAAVLILILLFRYWKKKDLYIPLALIVIFTACHVPLVFTNLFPYQVYSRYMMVPALGLAWLIAHYLTKLSEKIRMTIATVLLIALTPAIIIHSNAYLTESAFWRNAKRFSPRDAYVDYQLAQTFSKSKDLLTAEIILNNSLKLNIRREIAILISLLYSDLEYERANYTDVERWMKSIEGLENDSNVKVAPFIRYNINYNRARAALSEGDPATAGTLFRQNIERYPNIRQTYTQLYNLYLGYMMWDKAAELERVMKARFAKSYADIDSLKSKRDFETATPEGRIGFYVIYRNFGQAIEFASSLNRADADHRIFLAKLYYWYGRPKEGRAIIDALEKENSRSVELLNKIGNFYLSDIFRAAEAVEFFKKSLAVNKKQPQVAYTADRVERDYLRRLKPVWK
jgi:hypothetical protein